MFRTLIAGALTLALLTACVPRDGGMGDVWKGVSCVRKGTC
nr:hypothetical protein [Methylobacterium sp. ZNC0032]